MLENVWIKSTFPYAMSPCHEEAKWNTIRVVRRASAKLPHYTDPALVYPMENEMPLVHHVVVQWGCDYIDEDDKGLSKDPRTSNVEGQVQALLQNVGAVH